MSDSPTGSPSPSPCPDAATLEALFFGRLPADSLDAVAEHVAGCPRCATGLSDLQQKQAGSDPLLERLRRCGQTPALAGEGGFARLEEAARAIVLPVGVRTFADPASAGQPENLTASEQPGKRSTRALPARVGLYEIVGQLGEGGMGVVYRGWHPVLNRAAAVKMVLAGIHAGASTLARFCTEGKAITRLRHPHVVEIFDFAEHEGLPYFAMELVDGGTLAARLSPDGLPPRTAAELVAKVASAVEVAHGAGVLHRDLKPANILLTAAGEPKVADFGLAKLLDQDPGNTQPDVVLGTPSYMAPEQAEGRHDAVGPTTDVYGLGAVLYHALTGKPPFKGSTRTETRRQVVHEAVPPPRKLQPQVPPVLEAICLKCLEKDQARRYPTARALADDLGCFLRGEPTQAQPPTWPRRAVRWTRRHLVGLGLAVLLLLGLVVLYERDPQRAVEAALRATARGDSVTLVGDGEGPAWSRLHTWDGLPPRTHVRLTQARDGSFALDTTVPCLLELLPETGCDSYRLSAMVRHDEAINHGEVGLFFGLATDRTDASTCQSYVLMHFRGMSYPSAVLRAKEMKLTHLNPTKLSARFYLGPEPIRQGFGPDLATGTTFVAERPEQKAVWHALEAWITPDGIRTSFDGKPAGSVTANELEKQAVEWLTHRHGPAVVDRPTFHWRGGLGLYLEAGAASFRNVVLAPL